MRRIATVIAASAICIASLPSVLLATEAPDTAALASFGRCLSERGRVLVAFVIDQSESLRTTDPNDERVSAASAAIGGLMKVAQTPLSDGTLPKVDLMIAGFDSTYQPARGGDGWVSLTRETEPEVRRTLREYADRDSGLDTDFYEALAGARAALVSRAARVSSAGPVPVCKALLLFTDGEFDIEAQPGEKRYAPGVPITEENLKRIETLGKEAVCRRGGVSDQLRREEITPIVLTLNVTGFDPRFIRSVATGVACGSKGGAPGVFATSRDLDRLLEAFYRIAAGLSGGTPRTPRPEGGSACRDVVCARGTRTFEIGDSLGSFNVFVRLGSADVRTFLRAPHARRPLVVTDGEADAGKVGRMPIEITRLSEVAFTIGASRPPDGRGWTGTWSVTFVDERDPLAPVYSQVYLYGDLVPSLADDMEFHSGSANTVVVGVESKMGEPVTPSRLVDDIRMKVTVTDPTTRDDVTLDLDERDGRWVGTYTPRQDTATSSVNVTAELTVVTSEDVSLIPTTSVAAVPVLPPVSFPHLSPPELQLRTLVVNGNDQTRGSITVVGPEDGDGCVWFERATFERLPTSTVDPIVSFEPAATSEESCVQVRAGEEKVVEVVVTPGERARGEGGAAGYVSTYLRSDESGQTLSQKVPLSFNVAVRPDALIMWAAFLILGAGLTLPLAGLWMVNRATGKFQALAGLRAASIPVRVEEKGRVLRVGAAGPVPLAIDPVDFENVGDDTRRRRAVEWKDLRLVRRVSINPFTPPRGEVVEPRMVVSGDTCPRNGGSRARLPLALAGEWLFVCGEISLQEEARVFTGTLYAFIAEGASTAVQADRILERVSATLPEAVGRLSVAADDAATGEGSSNEEAVIEGPLDTTVLPTTTTWEPRTPNI